MDQLTIFDIMYPKYKITKPIRLIEFFAGYGSQALALKYLGVSFEHWKICEWAVKSIQAYKDIHFADDNIDYLALQPYSDKRKWLISWLYEKGISSNYNEPMTKEQISRLNDEQLKKIYNNIVATSDMVNIQKVKGKDLEIVDTDKYDYILTYSFPCQDLSLAGKGKGMSDISTRSGMLWEVERILTECYELGTLPQILLMENVPQVHGADNLQDFNKWQLRLDELGYKNYMQDLIATDYGIPQTRNRCFMVSILGNYSYTFPKPIPLKLKLKDLLENNVDEKYYLSDKMIQYIFSEDDKYKVNKNSLKLNREIACSKTTREGWTRADTSDYICEDKIKIATKPQKIGSLYEDRQAGSIYSEEATCPTLTTESSNNWNVLLGEKIKIKNATKKGYLEATDGDGIDLSQPNSETRRGRVQKEQIQTLTTQNNLGVVEDLRIRKLTPKECFRLMGVKDEDYEKCAKNQSDGSLYHLAGDSIVVNVLMAIFKELLKIKEI